MTKLFRLIFVTMIVLPILPAAASCPEDCDAAYAECKAATSSPNGEKVCGSDYHDCKTSCAESGQ